MSTAAKVGLVLIVLILIGVFGYSQLSPKTPDESILVTDDSGSVASSTDQAAVAKGSGDVDQAAATIVAGASGEQTITSQEDADSGSVTVDKQSINDLTQSYNQNAI